MTAAAVADPVAREFLRNADPVLARVLLSGDLALRHAVQRLYELDHLPTEGDILDIAERWRPYRSLAVSYLFASEFEESQ
jgi:3-methyladenine DNA glycosylase/8-oxoguanine DNA glycosylase